MESDRFKDVINNKRTDFDKFWSQLRASHELPPTRKRTSNIDVRTSCLSLYYEIIDSILQITRERFKI
jgi:hypothetical protein